MNKMMSTIVSLAIMVMSLISLPQNAYADYGFSASTKSDYGFNGTTQTGHGFVQASAPSAGSDVLNISLSHQLSLQSRQLLPGHVVSYQHLPCQQLSLSLQPV